jgi:hypothetical protein
MFAFSCGAQPEDIAFVDDDVKGKSTVDNIKAEGKDLGCYVDLRSRGTGKKELEFHQLCLSVIDELKAQVEKRGKPFDVLIWDTWTRFENTFHPYIVTYPTKFRQYWSPNGAIKGAEQWKESFRYEGEVLASLLNIAGLVILTTHLKPENISGRRTGKLIPDCKPPIINMSVLRVYLRHNSDGPAPVGLILKRPAKQTITEDGIEIVSVLPRKMKPFTWSEIRRYWKNPVGDRQMSKEELPDDWELSILDGTLTADQKKIWEAQEGLTEDPEEAPVFPAEIVDRARELKAGGSPLPTIVKTINEEFGSAVSMPDVTKMLAGA